MEQTIKSVLGQTFTDFEYIIVDGASTDGSVDVINKLEPEFTIPVTWISEPDKGIYNAMNKGTRMASGKYLLFLNSGDSFVSNETLICLSNQLGKSDILIGRENITDKGVVINTTPLLQEKDLSLYNLYLKGIPHQASFIRRQLLLDNPYDETLRINSDWKFFIQAIVFQNVSVNLNSTIIANYDNNGLSSSHIDELRSERDMILKQIMPDRIYCDYSAIFPHYYEVIRIQWLLKHNFFYKIYRIISSIGIKICK